jgi:hypothetical protein
MASETFDLALLMKLPRLAVAENRRFPETATAPSQARCDHRESLDDERRAK